MKIICYLLLKWENYFIFARVKIKKKENLKKGFNQNNH